LVSLINGLGKLNFYVQKCEIGLLSYPTHKDQLKTGPVWGAGTSGGGGGHKERVKRVNMASALTMNLDSHTKTEVMKTKFQRQKYIKLKSLCTAKGKMNKMKRHSTH
jgi:hypothetical protein